MPLLKKKSCKFFEHVHINHNLKNEWINELPLKFHLEGSTISRCLVTSRGEEFHLSSFCEVKPSVESQNDEKMKNVCEVDERMTSCARHKTITQRYP